MPVAPLTFEEIPYDWRVPGTYVEVRPSYASMGLVGYPSRVLLIGQKIAAGTATAAVPRRITRREEAAALYGPGSVLSEMVDAFLRVNRTTELWAMCLADAGGAVAATGTFAITGTATAAGTLAAYVGGVRVAVPVAVGATATQVGAALATAVGANPDLPVTAANASGTVTCTSKHLGTVANDIDLRLNYQQEDATPAGLTVTVTGMASGTGTPTLATALAAVAAEWFTDIAVAWGDSTSLGVLTTDLATRYAAMGKLDAHAYVGLRGTFGSLSSAGAAQNSQYLTLIGANASPTSPWAWAATLAGVAAFQLANDPARQLRTLPLTGVRAPAVAARFTPSERDLLLRDGISTWEVGQDGTVRLERVITAYQTSPGGIADTAWLDITVPRTLSRLRYDWASYVGLLYPRHKLADDAGPGIDYGEAVVTPRQMHGTWATRCKLYEQLGWIEQAKRTAEESVFQRSASDRNRLEARQRVRLLGNLVMLAASLQFEV